MYSNGGKEGRKEGNREGERRERGGRKRAEKGGREVRRRRRRRGRLSREGGPLLVGVRGRLEEPGVHTCGQLSTYSCENHSCIREHPLIP